MWLGFLAVALLFAVLTVVGSIWARVLAAVGGWGTCGAAALFAVTGAGWVSSVGASECAPLSPAEVRAWFVGMLLCALGASGAGGWAAVRAHRAVSTIGPALLALALVVACIGTLAVLAGGTSC